MSTIAGATDVYATGSADQNVINEALKSGGDVYLHGGKVYDITGPIYIYSNTKLHGDADTTLRVNAGSGQWYTGRTGIINNAEVLENVEIYGFAIDGNIGNLPASYADYGNGKHNAERLIYLMGNKKEYMDNVRVHDMQLQDSFSDGCQLAYCENSQVYNNFISNCQHESIFLICAVNTAVYSNELFGITSDCLRLDNCVNCTIFSNMFYSYTGDNLNGQGTNGENAVQIADEGYSHGGGSAKPLSTTNIEVFNNTFANTGLRSVWLDSTGKGVTNVYIHDNTFLTGKELETAGVPVYTNISYTNMPTVKMSREIFTSIFDVLNAEFTDSGLTNQNADSIPYTAKETEQGKIAGYVKIVGFKNQISIDGKSYISSPDDVLVKYSVIRAPSLNSWFGDIADTKPEVKTSIENGTATAIMTVKVKWYNYKRVNGKVSKGKIQESEYVFSDSCGTPEILQRQTNISAYANIFDDTKNQVTRLVVPYTNTTQKIEVVYGENKTVRKLMIGEVIIDNNEFKKIIYTKCDSWTGEIPHMGEEFIIVGKFDPTKLNIKHYTPYESSDVKNIELNYHKNKGESTLLLTLKFIVYILLAMFAGYKIMTIIM